MLQMLHRSQYASQMPSWPAAAGYRHVPYAPGPYESPRNALAPSFAAPAVPTQDTLAPRFAATEVSPHDMLAPHSAAMEASPHGATPREEQAGLPALLAAGVGFTLYIPAGHCPWLSAESAACNTAAEQQRWP